MGGFGDSGRLLGFRYLVLELRRAELGVGLEVVFSGVGCNKGGCSMSGGVLAEGLVD